MKKLWGAVFILFIFNMLAGCATVGGQLIHAADAGQTTAIKDLLDKGGDVNERGLCGGWTIGGDSGATPLLCAALNGHMAAVKLLIDRGADVNAKGNGTLAAGFTPLTAAACGGHASIAKFLIEKGADTDYALAKLSKLGIKEHYKFLETILEKQHPSQYPANTASREVIPVIKSDIDELPAITSDARNNAFAIVIGIENYRSIPKSDYSRKDATLVKSYLKALGYQERNIEFLADERATRTDIEKSLEAWLPNRARKDSTVLVYFSGHGAPEPASGEAYLVPYDGDPNYLPVTGYPLKRLYESLGKLEVKEIIVVLDSCFSGSGGRSVLAKGARPLVMMAPAGILPSNIVVLSATQGSQISTSSPQKGHGVFTYYFLKAIKDGKQNIAEIYAHITPQVEDEAKLLNVQQTPSISPDVEKIKGRFSLRK